MVGPHRLPHVDYVACRHRRHQCDDNPQVEGSGIPLRDYPLRQLEHRKDRPHAVVHPQRDGEGRHSRQSMRRAHSAAYAGVGLLGIGEFGSRNAI